MEIRTLLVAALLVVASSAVSAKKYVAPTPVAAELPVEVYLPQQEMEIDTPDTTRMASQGLAWALVAGVVNNVQTKRAEERVALLRNWFLDYDFNARYEQAIRAKLAFAELSPAPRFIIVNQKLELAPGLMSDDANSGDSVSLGMTLKVQGRYAMSYDLQKMYVKSSVYLVERTRKPNGKLKEKTHLWRTYTFDVPLGRTWGVDADVNMRRWIVIGRDEMLRLLDLSIDQSTDMVAYDFSAAGRAMAERGTSSREESLVKGEKVEGKLIREEKDWYWLLNTTPMRSALNGWIAGHYPLVAEARAPEAPEDAATAPGSPQ